jgi:hypothetical protein
MLDDQLLYRILAAARIVHMTLGPGFIESIYTRAPGLELATREYRLIGREPLRSGMVPRWSADIDST